MVPMIRNILGGFLFSGDDIYKKRRRAVRRRAHAAGRGAHAAAAGQHAAARRADQPPRPGLEGRAARSARGLRRHADLRVARSLLRRQARHQDHRGRPRRRSRSIRAPTSSSSGARRSAAAARPAAAPADPSGPKHAKPKPQGAPHRPAAGAQNDRHRSASRPRRPATARTRRRSERDAETRRRRRGRRTTASGGLPTSKAESPNANRRSRTWRPRWRRPGFYDDRDTAEPSSTRHQPLMWEVGDLMNQWETLQEAESCRLDSTVLLHIL